MVEQLSDTGSVNAWLTHEHDNWPTNGNDYNFGPFQIEGNVHLHATKVADGTLTVLVDGPHGEVFKFVDRVPPDAKKAVMVTVTWNETSATLYLNGEAVQTRNL